MKPSFNPVARTGSVHRLGVLALTLSLALAAVPAMVVGSDVEFSPAQPTSLDPIQVSVSGTWPTDCAPELFDLVVDGSEVRVEIAENVVLPCESVPTDYFIEGEFPPLAAGTYDLLLIFWGPFAPTQLDQTELVITEGGLPSLRSLSLHPPQPTTTDRIQVVASGEWMDGCVPEWSATEVDGTDIVISTLTPGEFCVQQVTPFDVVASIGPLPAGTYDLTTLVADELGLPAEEIPILGARSFTVLEAAATKAVLNGRFEVQVSFEDTQGTPGTARVMSGALPSGSEVVSSSGETALFWFFSPDNTEVVVKVLDACGINERFWVFGSAATDLAFTLTVTDLETSEVRTYENSAGQPAMAINDTNAFETCSP